MADGPRSPLFHAIVIAGAALGAAPGCAKHHRVEPRPELDAGRDAGARDAGTDAGRPDAGCPADCEDFCDPRPECAPCSPCIL
ncbi:MAG TPA: hypothetical protein RMH85_07785 [Polyangiaceae bacterium LLY-WYZ-15_(1-7)]|nr:hypothetical protein [Polyangiaceae bacterium LLY-WYZ-15_(1-7)]HJL08382.1 hypothetical protein [Polyangiaceae bacterium LLY-WYZ-15_(1-7)]HJL26410.1 hypothetical protein [Polyangiaceae bacterium LLY-WYZ-15_(1-7)]HJL37676.1 hypothetical protein [Polyangiaceae bacterium LLY-WYZ-15_(1-7)]